MNGVFGICRLGNECSTSAETDTPHFIPFCDLNVVQSTSLSLADEPPRRAQPGDSEASGDPAGATGSA